MSEFREFLSPTSKGGPLVTGIPDCCPHYRMARAPGHLPVNPGDSRDVGLTLDWEGPLEKEMETPSSILAWRIPWTEEPSRLQAMGSQASDMT